MIRTHIRLWFKRQYWRLLNRSSEVRELRTLQTEYEARCRKWQISELEHRKHAERADTERAKVEHELADTKKALELMTEARLNAERAVDVIRAQMDGLRETTDREIASMKQMVDWFGLEGRGRQVFGTAPLVTRPKEEQPEVPPQRISGRHLTQQATQEFLRQAEERLRAKQALAEQNGGMDFSTTSRAVEESVA